MTDKNIPVEDILEERYCLAAERVKELTQEKDVPEPFRSFFAEMAEFLEKILNLKEEIAEGKYQQFSLEELRKKNKELYEDILPQQYGQSYGNPDYAAEILGKSYGPLFSFLYTELRGLIV